MSQAGKWALKHWTGGHPVWCQLEYEGQEIAHGIHHRDLRDLQYVIERAILEVRNELPPNYKHEID